MFDPSDLVKDFNALRTGISRRNGSQLLTLEMSNSFETIQSSFEEKLNSMRAVHRDLNQYRKLKPAAERVVVLCRSASDGILSGDVTVADITKIRKEVIKIMAEFADLVKVSMQANDAKEDKKDRKQMHDKHKNLDHMLRQVSQDLRTYSEYKRHLPDKHSDSDFVQLRMPVAPLLEYPPSVADLKKMGIKAANLGDADVIVMEKQLVVGLNTRKARDQGANIQKQALTEYAEAILRIINNTSTKSKFELVTEESAIISPGIRNSGHTYYWLMERSRLNRLVSSGSFSLMEWSLAV